MSSIKINTVSLYNLDFREAQHIAEMVGFDVLTYAAKLRSCGPGCDYFSKDKKYYITMLLNHIALRTADGQKLTAEVRQWYARAQQAEQEYRDMEEHHLHIRRSGVKKTV